MQDTGHLHTSESILGKDKTREERGQSMVLGEGTGRSSLVEGRSSLVEERSYSSTEQVGGGQLWLSARARNKKTTSISEYIKM